MMETSALHRERERERGGWGRVRNHGKIGSVKRHEVWRRNAVWKHSANEQ